MCPYALLLPCPVSPQRGATLIEFVAGASMVLALGIAALETAHWQVARQIAAVALLEAARAGTTRHGDPAAMAQAFEQGMRALHAAGRPGQAGLDRLRAVHAARRSRAGVSAWHIHVMTPHAAHFADFGQRGAGPDGQRAIVPDYQHEQHQEHVRRWPGGRGPRSGQTIFEANVLQLRLTYLHEPLTPLLSGLLRALGQGRGDRKGLAMARAGYLPLAHEIALTQQSAAMQWPSWAAHGGEISQ